MNERIQELSEQAQLYARQGMGKCVIELKRFDADAVSERYAKDFEEKFAELIVKECTNYINERTLDWDADLRWIFNDGSGDMAVNVDDLLNRHFGIEE